MSNRYIAWQGRTPRCDLPGSPFTSRKAAKQAAAREGIANPTVTPVRRSA